MRFRVAIIFAGVCALLAACGEEKRSAEQDDMIEPDSGKGANNWLHAADHTEPALWLARREAGGRRQRTRAGGGADTGDSALGAGACPGDRPYAR